MLVTRLIKLSLTAVAALLLLLVTLCALMAVSEQVLSHTVIGAGASQLTSTRAEGTLPNGVAAGDTSQTSTVLWTRATTVGVVLFEYSNDPTFNSNLLTEAASVSETLQPVKVVITGLNTATTYYYRATDAAGASAAGLFRTAAATDTHAGLRFGVSGDWNGQLAPYPSIANADERDLDFFAEHGDTIYAGSATTLEQFRLKHNQVYSTHLGLNTWADLRGATSIRATIDDLEVRNDFAGGADAATDSRFTETSGFINETQIYRNALQAFQEYNPLRDEFYGATGDPRTANKRRLYRFNTYGRDAAVFVLDTRSFRDEQLTLTDPSSPTQIIEFLTNSLGDTSRTMLGARQLADLKAGLQRAQTNDVTWKFVLVPGPIQNLGIFKAHDRYEGYAAERTALLRFIEQNGINNVVFVAAGLHGTVVNNLTYQEVFLGPQIPTGAFEVIVGPVAIYPPFGPAVIDLAEAYGLITPEERAIYDGLSRDDKDEFVRQLLDEYLLAPLGYDPVGLDGSGIEATLLHGGYVAVHTYGWTEFEIDQGTQILTVTTYGIDPYSEAELAATPGDVITRTPTVVSQFVVPPYEAPSWISVTATIGEASIYPGETATYTLSVSVSEGFSDPVTLTLLGAPPDALVSFDPHPVDPPGTSQLYVTTTASSVTGTYVMTATGAASQVTDTASLTLTIESKLAPTLTMTAQPDVHIILPGDTASYTLALTASEGFTAPVTLTLQGAPPDAVVSLDPNPVNPPGTSQLYITTTASTLARVYTMTASGSSGALTATANLTLIVASVPPSFTLSVSPTTRIALPNQLVTYTVALTGVDGFNRPVTLAVAGLPADVGAVWSANPVTPDAFSTLTLSIPSGPLLFGEYTLQVIGVAEAQTVSTNIKLIIDFPFKIFLPKSALSSRMLLT